MIISSEQIESFYKGLPLRISKAREILMRLLTLTEKILFSHLADSFSIASFKRGSDYVEFTSDRVAMQDATEQMDLLQFTMTGKEKSEIPASVHCDHLIMAKSGFAGDGAYALLTNSEVYDFLSSVCNKYSIDFWKPGAGIIHQVILENSAFNMIRTNNNTSSSNSHI